MALFEILFKFIIRQQLIEMKVYSPQQNYKLQKIMLASKVYKKNVELEKVQFEPKVSKSFKDAYPQYTLPLLQTQDNKFITGTHSILLFLAGQQNLTDQTEKVKIIEELQKIQREVDSATGVLVLHAKGFSELSEGQIQKSKDILSKYIKEINERLAFKTFLASDRLTVADISAYFNIWAVTTFFDKEIEKLKNIQRWLSHMESLTR